MKDRIARLVRGLGGRMLLGACCAAAVGVSPLIADPPSEIRFRSPEGPVAAGSTAPVEEQTTSLRLLPVRLPSAGFESISLNAALPADATHGSRRAPVLPRHLPALESPTFTQTQVELATATDQSAKPPARQVDFHSPLETSSSIGPAVKSDDGGFIAISDVDTEWVKLRQRQVESDDVPQAKSVLKLAQPTEASPQAKAETEEVARLSRGSTEKEVSKNRLALRSVADSSLPNSEFRAPNSSLAQTRPIQPSIKRPMTPPPTEYQRKDPPTDPGTFDRFEIESVPPKQREQEDEQIALQGDEDPFGDGFSETPSAETPFADPQPTPAPAPAPLGPVDRQPTRHIAAPAETGPFEVLNATGELTVTRRRSKLMRSQDNIYRVAVVDPTICDVLQFTPREVSVIGKGMGATHVTFWFEDGQHRPVTYLVRVVPDPEVADERDRQYQILTEILTELFPDSKVDLQPVSNKLIVRGQAKDAAEAAQIMAVIRGEAVYGGSPGAPYYGSLVSGTAAPPLSDQATGNPLPAANIINMLQIPGVQQVALRVKIAELNRTAAREFGVDLDMTFDVGDGALLLQTMLNAATGKSIVGNFDNNQINFGIHYLQQRGVIRVLSEPTLVTLSGRPASFVAGGEFAVPTTVGVGGASAVTTDFRAFGVILNFLPVVLDKDRVRLEISPEFSKINSDLTVNGTPGLNTRAVTTTVEMREGQTLAIAGLLEDTMDADNSGDLPLLAKILGKRSVSRAETELIILVTPELVHPMEPEAVPPLPGFDVTEPTDGEFFLHGRIEGYPTRDHRSTVWPRLRQRYRSGGTSMISGPFGHGQ